MTGKDVMHRALDYARQHAIATIALVCSLLALATSSYAAFFLPPGSVGNRELKNHAINPDKLNPRFVGGYVRAWASVSARGRVITGGGKPHVHLGAATGQYIVQWHAGAFTGCVPNVGVQGSPFGRSTSQTSPGFAIAGGNHTTAQRGAVGIATYNAQAQAAALPFYVAVICATPR